MNTRQIASANALYMEDFCSPMSSEAIEIAKTVKTVDDLYTTFAPQLRSAAHTTAKGRGWLFSKSTEKN
jgi:hypothetical protein